VKKLIMRVCARILIALGRVEGQVADSAKKGMDVGKGVNNAINFLVSSGRYYTRQRYGLTDKEYAEKVDQVAAEVTSDIIFSAFMLREYLDRYPELAVNFGVFKKQVIEEMNAINVKKIAAKLNPKNEVEAAAMQALVEKEMKEQVL